MAPERVTPILLAADERFRPAAPERGRGVPGASQSAGAVRALPGDAPAAQERRDAGPGVRASPRAGQRRSHPGSGRAARLAVRADLRADHDSSAWSRSCDSRASSPTRSRRCGIVARPCSRSRVGTRDSVFPFWRRWRAEPPSSRRARHPCRKSLGTPACSSIHRTSRDGASALRQLLEDEPRVRRSQRLAGPAPRRSPGSRMASGDGAGVPRGSSIVTRPCANAHPPRRPTPPMTVVEPSGRVAGRHRARIRPTDRPEGPVGRPA